MTGSQLWEGKKMFRPIKQQLKHKMSLSKGRRLTLLFSTCSFVLCRNVHNPISIDVKSDLDLRDTTRGRGDSDKSELTQHFVVCCHFSLSLTNFNFHLSLAISCCGEHLQHNTNTLSHFQTLRWASLRLIHLPGSFSWELWCFCWWVWWRHRPGSQYPKRAGLHPTAAHQWHHRPRHLPGWLLQWPLPRRDWQICLEFAQRDPEQSAEPAKANSLTEVTNIWLYQSPWNRDAVWVTMGNHL